MYHLNWSDLFLKFSFHLLLLHMFIPRLNLSFARSVFVHGSFRLYLAYRGNWKLQRVLSRAVVQYRLRNAFFVAFIKPGKKTKSVKLLTRVAWRLKSWTSSLIISQSLLHRWAYVRWIRRKRSNEKSTLMQLGNGFLILLWNTDVLQCHSFNNKVNVEFDSNPEPTTKEIQ